MSLLSKKGFTLIELLVTVGIIVILATLIIVNIAQARMSGRDAKRIADVASIQLALEMYKNSKGVYPFSLDTNPVYTYSNWAVAGSLTPAEQTNWNLLGGSSSTTDKGLQPYLSPLPKDPLNKPGYRYYIWIYPDASSRVNSIGAIIKTKLESDNNLEKMTDDSCGIDNGSYDVISGVRPATDDKCSAAEMPTS